MLLALIMNCIRTSLWVFSLFFSFSCACLPPSTPCFSTLCPPAVYLMSLNQLFMEAILLLSVLPLVSSGLLYFYLSALASNGFNVVRHSFKCHLEPFWKGGTSLSDDLLPAGFPLPVWLAGALPTIKSVWEASCHCFMFITNCCWISSTQPLQQNKQANLIQHPLNISIIS